TTQQSVSRPALAKAIPILSTPKKEASPQPSTPARQNGQWTHPRMDEVLRRRNATNFDSSNVTSILISSVLIILSLYTPNLLFLMSVALQLLMRCSSDDPLRFPTSWLAAAHPYPRYAVWIFRAAMSMNIAIATLPLWRKPDACEDVPLTPQQRKLLGLPPMTRPATPQEQEQYVTPPRFSRPNTPGSRSSSLNATRGNSPLSARGTPIDSNGSFRMSGSGSNSLWGSPAPGNQLRRTESGNSLLGDSFNG
ncbi:hypothetical protein CERZMDRAFT_3628, partial [Cercospora zeae-maydis SCOH1-5]